MELEIRWFANIFLDSFVEAIFSDKENKKDNSANKIVLKKLKMIYISFHFILIKK